MYENKLKLALFIASNAFAHEFESYLVQLYYALVVIEIVGI